MRLLSITIVKVLPLSDIKWFLKIFFCKAGSSLDYCSRQISKRIRILLLKICFVDLGYNIKEITLIFISSLCIIVYMSFVDLEPS